MAGQEGARPGLTDRLIFWATLATGGAGILIGAVLVVQTMPTFGRVLVWGGLLAFAGLVLIGPTLTRVFIGKVLAVAGLLLLAFGALGQWGVPWLAQQADQAVHSVVEKVVDEASQRAQTDVVDTLKDKVGWDR